MIVSRRNEWTQVVVPSSDGLCFPNMCPGCLRPKPSVQLRVRSEKGRLRGFYLVATKWEHLWVTVPFCGDCAKRRKRWENRDLALLLIAAIAALAFAIGLAASFNLPPWGMWGIFLGVAWAFTALCGRLVSDHRAVRINRYDDNAIIFTFSHSEYAQEFAQLNGQTAPVGGSS